MTIWLFGLVYAAGIKKMKYPDLQEVNKARYFTMTLQMICLVIVIITWPAFNSLMATLDIAIPNLYSTALLVE